MRIEIVGPLLFWSVMFTIASAIKYIAFDDVSVLFAAAPDAALWATGVLFSLAASEETYFRAKLVPHVSRHASGSGYTVNYTVTLGDQLRFTAKFLYLFLSSMAAWLLCLLAAGIAEQGVALSTVIVATAVAYFLAALTMTMAIRTLIEVAE